MSGTTTPRLGLPYIAVGQAQKEAAHAAALNRIDAMVPGVANSVGDTSPPGSPAEGDVYCLGASPTGAWSGQGGKVAHYVGGGWIFITPRTGWRVYAVDEAKDYRWSGSAWVEVTAAGGGGSGRADVAPPAVSTWTWVNQGRATATHRSSSGASWVSMYSPSNGAVDNYRLLVRATPTPPYRAVFRLVFGAPPRVTPQLVTAWRNSGGGTPHYFGWRYDGSNGSRLFISNVSGVSVDYFHGPMPQWFGLRDNNTDRFFEISPDGYEWVTIASFGRTTNFTPDQIGFGINNFVSASPQLGASCALFSYETE